MAMKKLSRLVLATQNQHKLAEVGSWFAPWGLQVLALSDFTREMPPETGETFAENAYIKARYGYEVSGLPTLADDSGLEVDALGGAPGVRSARYAGEGAGDAANNRKLLAELEGDGRRSARFRCAMALVVGEVTIQAEGTVEGIILREPRGSGGFGYDPLFWLPEHGMSMAELSAQEKNEVSHRARALAALVEKLREGGLF